MSRVEDDGDVAMVDNNDNETNQDNNDAENGEDEEYVEENAKTDRVKEREATLKRNQKLAEQSTELRKKKAADQMKRYAYLLGQTDLFAHFINLKKMKGEDVSAFTAATESENKKNSKARDGSRRHRMTEKEEDEEMLQQEPGAEDAPPQFTESPKYVTGGTMRDYQLQGLNWLISLHYNGINGILADEMGLGKTLQSISFLGYLKHSENIPGKHLIIVPKSTLHNWMTEIKRWVPDLKPFLFHGDKEARAKLVKETLLVGDFEVCVTSYEMCLLEKAALRKISWECLVIDEAHRIKNENSSLSQIVREFQCRNRLLLTGTPLQNNLHELWALLNFLLPDIFSSSEDFDEWFNSRGNGDQDQVVQQLHKVLRPFLLRRIKSDVEKTLLPKKRINLYVGMSTMQRRWYQKILEKDIDAVNGSLEPGPPYTTDQHLIDNAGKMAILDKLLARCKTTGSRVLLFSQMSRMLDILEDYCVFRGFEYCRIDGQTAHEDRIASLGINLATADTVVMYDSDWNPQVDLQAEDRAHRIGQTKQVVVYRFITENAIEEKVIDRATQKLRLDQLVIQQGRAQQKQATAASKDELISMIQHGAESIFQSVDSTITSDDIDEILRRGEAKTQELDSKYKNMGLEDAISFISDGTGSVYQWEGADFRNQKKDGGFRWIQPAKREKRGTNLRLVGSYAVDDYYRQALRVGNKAAGGRPIKGTKMSLNDFQFYPPELVELLEREWYAKLKAQGYKPSKRAPQTPEEDEEFLERERQEEQSKIDAAEPLSEEEQEEKSRLMEQTFENWTRKDFMAFIKANEKYGRENLDAIAAEIEGKSQEEVKAYSEVFWKRYKEIQDYEKYINTIERGENRLQNQMRVQDKGKNYTEEEDRFMIVCLEKFGYGTDDVYERIREEIKRSTLFRFDWFIKSRTAAELSRRCSTLIGLIQKEESEEREREEKKRNAPPGEDSKAKRRKKA
ncbi:hypothetical protein HDU76_004637 [Blyttiomyces sp. JEL0837]|nr:hypothetical protein HDU76_004637 [Blyttiomyces sp. JEL0837]